MKKLALAHKLLPSTRSTFLRILIALPILQFFLLTIPFWSHHPSRFGSPPWSHPQFYASPIDPTSALLTPIPESLPDGLGHRIGVVNFELRLARALAVRYLHRLAFYDSLTRYDRFAVDKLFGWYGIEDTRERALQGCVVERRFYNCTYKAGYPVCVGLKKDSPYDRLVNIPVEKVECLRKPSPKCWKNLKKWSVQFPEKTLFQMQPGVCHDKYLSGDFAYTRAWFRNRYWDYHGSVYTPRFLKPRVSLDNSRFQIGVHIRRGDFLNESLREVIPDVTYADVVCMTKRAANGVFNADVPIDVHIFSEGVVQEKHIHEHDTNRMKRMYVTDKGFAVGPDQHWQRLIKERCVGDVAVKTHIASDTVDALHDMIAADVFVGSRSGMSIHIVEVLSRGVVVNPPRKWRRANSTRMNGEWAISYDYDKATGSAIVDELELGRCLKEMRRDGALRGIQLYR